MGKKVLEFCPNYYEIVNYNFQENDYISEKIVSIYKKFIFSNSDTDLITKLDSVISNYIHDYEFRSQLQKEILNIRIKRDNNILDNLVNNIFKIFNNYEEYTTRRIYISKWI